MASENDPLCPAKLHGSDAAGNGLGLLYQRREECALLHACERETCEIAGEWPARNRSQEDAAWRLFAFIALAHGGPRERV
jgi:hypothetical protein